jgi:hypothetical protein
MVQCPMSKSPKSKAKPMKTILLIAALLVCQDARAAQGFTFSDPAFLAAAGGRAFNPTNNTTVTNLFLWVAARFEAYANNDPVGSVTDQSGHGNNGSQTGGARPTFKTGVQSGRPGFLFADTHSLDFGNVVNLTTSNMTFYVVGNTTETGMDMTPRAYIVKLPTVTDGAYWLWRFNGILLSGYYDGIADKQAGFLSSSTTHHIYTVTLNRSGGTNSIRADGVLQQATPYTPESANISNSGSLTLGLSHIGHIEEVLVYYGAHTEFQSRTVEAFLNGYYNTH